MGEDWGGKNNLIETAWRGKAPFLKVVMSGLGFEGSIRVDRTDKRTLGDTVCTNVWYLGNCSQAGIVEATLCLCMGVICMSMHMSHTHKCILVCVHVRMRLKMRLERHTRVGL